VRQRPEALLRAKNIIGSLSGNEGRRGSFASPSIYEFLEAEGSDYAIRSWASGLSPSAIRAARPAVGLAGEAEMAQPEALIPVIQGISAKKGNPMSEREQYIEKVKAQLDQWNAEIDKLQAKADEAEADAKIEYEKQINELRAQRDEAEAKAKELQETSNDAWADMKAGFDRAWDSLSNAFANAMSRFK
jgi:hypothetical protein